MVYTWILSTKEDSIIPLTVSKTETEDEQNMEAENMDSPSLLCERDAFLRITLKSESFSSASSKGSVNNDKIRMDGDKPVFETNNAGGILGGISNGDQIVFKTYFKPTPSISSTQETINDEKKEIELTIKGRHDPCIGVRAVVVVEAMASAVILDFLLRRRCDRI